MFAEVVDLSVSHYIYSRERTKDRIERYLQIIELKNSPVLAMQAQVQFLNPLASYNARRMIRLTVALEESSANQRCLGNYHELF